MKSRIRYAVYSLFAISIVLTVLLAYPEVNRPRAKAHAGAPIASMVPGIAGMADEASVTLKPAEIQTFNLFNYAFPSNTTYWPCFGKLEGLHASRGAPVRGENEVVAGYLHDFEEGTKPFPCQKRANDFWRAGVWFDLSEIRSKLPGVFVTNALLHFRPVESFVRDSDGNPIVGTKFCANELLVASVDWKKGYIGLPPGGPFTSLSLGSGSTVICGLGGCSVEVGPVINNWVTGKEDDFGFLIKGEDEAPTTEDNAACWTRYDNFELTVNYKYNRTPPIIPPGGKLDIPFPPGGKLNIPLPGGRTNYALASNGAKASASSIYTDAYSPDKAIDGDHRGLNWAKGGGWNGAGPTNSDWLRIDFDGIKTIDEIDVFMLQDNYASPIEPDLSTTFSKFGLRGFEVQYINAFGFWTDVPDGEVSVNDKVWRQFKFPALKTKTIRVLVNNTPDGYSRIVEVEAWGH